MYSQDQSYADKSPDRLKPDKKSDKIRTLDRTFWKSGQAKMDKDSVRTVLSAELWSGLPLKLKYLYLELFLQMGYSLSIYRGI